MTKSAIVRKFERLIRQQNIPILRFNSFIAAAEETGLPPSHSQSRLAARKYQNIQKERLHAYSAIFGDTFLGMPIEDALEIIEDEGFKYANNNSYQHDYLGMTLLMFVSDGKLISITIHCDMQIIPNSINKNTMAGIGITEGNIIDDTRFIGKVEATGGLRLKLMCLRSFVSAEDAIDEPLNIPAKTDE